MCGFSNAVVQVMKAEGADFKGFNVLADPDLREGIKSYSSWPTIPQVYINGEFIGGCDTTIEMYKSGVRLSASAPLRRAIQTRLCHLAGVENDAEGGRRRARVVECHVLSKGQGGYVPALSAPSLVCSISRVETYTCRRKHAHERTPWVGPSLWAPRIPHAPRTVRDSHDHGGGCAKRRSVWPFRFRAFRRGKRRRDDASSTEHTAPRALEKIYK